MWGEVGGLNLERVRRGVRWLRSHQWWWIAVALIAAIFFAWRGWETVANTVGIRVAFHLVALAIRNFAAALGPWGPLLIMLALAAHSVIIIFPMEIPTLAAFTLYGPFGGLAVVWAGSMLTSFISYMLGRWIGPPILNRWMGNRRVRSVVRAIAHINPLALILLRWISFIPFDVLNMAFGSCEVPILRFAWTTSIGVLVSNAVMALLYRTAVHAHWTALVIFMVGAFILGWATYWWANRSHLKEIGQASRDDIEA